MSEILEVSNSSDAWIYLEKADASRMSGAMPEESSARRRTKKGAEALRHAQKKQVSTQGEWIERVDDSTDTDWAAMLGGAAVRMTDFFSQRVTFLNWTACSKKLRATARARALWQNASDSDAANSGTSGLLRRGVV